MCHAYQVEKYEIIINSYILLCYDSVFILYDEDEEEEEGEIKFLPSKFRNFFFIYK